MLGDIYLTLAWMAFQRLRYGPAWQATRRGYAPPVVTMLRPQETDEEGADTATPRRG
jgi:hypothetical protein